MREIKFRAWDIDNEVFLKPTEILIRAFNGATLRWDKSLLFNIEIQQFTGLQDKNGKDIFEGDIVKWGHAREWSIENPIRIAEVKINPDIQFHSQVGVFKFGNFAYADSIDKDLEVIGNIFENPELLTN